jgi:uncharacterized protein YciI
MQAKCAGSFARRSALPREYDDGNNSAATRGRTRRAMYFLLLYDVVDDYVERRALYRDDHLTLARAAHARGEIVLAGALAEPADGAALVFKTDDRAVVERFAQNDPYVLNGLVTRWRVRDWTVVVGGE